MFVVHLNHWLLVDIPTSRDEKGGFFFFFLEAVALEASTRLIDGEYAMTVIAAVSLGSRHLDEPHSSFRDCVPLKYSVPNCGTLKTFRTGLLFLDVFGCIESPATPCDTHVIRHSIGLLSFTDRPTRKPIRRRFD